MIKLKINSYTLINALRTLVSIFHVYFVLERYCLEISKDISCIYKIYYMNLYYFNGEC